LQLYLKDSREISVSTAKHTAHVNFSIPKITYVCVGNLEILEYVTVDYSLRRKLMKYISKIVELIGTATCWLFALALLAIAIFGGSVSFQMNGIDKLLGK
jgi:hypothetical protein